jgi:hypothetical protein
VRDVELIEVIPVESWRADYWPADYPSRPGWQVRCSVHGFLGEQLVEHPLRGRQGATSTRASRDSCPAWSAIADPTCRTSMKDSEVWGTSAAFAAMPTVG